MWCGTMLATFCFLASVPVPQRASFIGPAPTGAVAVDGDGIKGASPFGTLSVRLWGGNTVERGEPGWQEVKDAISALVVGQDIACTQMGPPSLGREVARCIRVSDGLDLMCEQIRAGHAQPTYHSRDFYNDCVASDAE